MSGKTLLLVRLARLRCPSRRRVQGDASNLNWIKIGIVFPLVPGRENAGAGVPLLSRELTDLSEPKENCLKREWI